MPITFDVKRARLEECDIEELMEALGLTPAKLLALIDDAGRDDLIHKAFKAVTNNVDDDDEYGDD